MAVNTIALAKKYLPLLDAVYAQNAKSSILDAPADLVRESINANEVLIAKIVLDGLGDYNRSTGYVAGSVDFAWQTFTFTQDRGRTFTIDAQDDEETLNVALASVSGEFIKTKVTPEVDAYRFAKIASVAGGSTSAVLDKDTVLPAIDLAKEALMEAEVETSSIVYFVSPLIYRLLKQASQITRQFVTNAGPKSINRDFETLDGSLVIVVPQKRFYSEITIYDGVTAGQEAGGYIKTAVTGKDINFIAMDVSAVMGVTKTAMPRLFDPAVNQSANAWKYDYRLYHELFAPEKKRPGIYVHLKTT